MNLSRFAASLALLLMIATAADAADIVRTSEKPYTGDITKMTALEVTIKKGAVYTKIPVNKITEIVFGGESAVMPAVRKFAASGRYEDAIEKLKTIKKGTGLKAYITQDVEFYLAFCRSQMALVGAVKATTAATELKAFADKNPNNFHYIECSELLGRLAVALGSYDKAKAYYAVLLNSPWPEYKIQAYTAVGEAEVAQGNFAKAAGMFDRALAIQADDDESQQNQRVALIGKGRCQAEAGNVAAGIATIDKVIKDVGPEARMLLSRAYVALGHCYKKDNKPKEAVLQFLMVDLVYNADRGSHADALLNLVELWQSIKKVENSRKSKARLQQLYPAVASRTR